MITQAVPNKAAEYQLQLARDLGGYTHDPLGYSKYIFPWGEGDLADSAGPRKWQTAVDQAISEHLKNKATRFEPCRIAVSSGHGIGKSAEIAMLTSWAMSTCENCKVVITAGTGTQLSTKTAPEVNKWFHKGLNANWWDINATSIRSKLPRFQANWRTDFITWSEHNTDAFQGLHNERKRILLVFDEASAIADKVWEVAEGALTDEETEIIWVAFGNMTKNSGHFYDVCFGKQRHRWKVFTIDSREVEGTNKAQIAEWVDDYGEDSDFVRVRVRGLAPRAASAQYIDMETIAEAQKRPAVSLPDDALVAGVDFAWGGADDNVVRFRCGRDARTIPPVRVKGEFTRDPAVMTNRLADILTKKHNGRSIGMMFVDSAGIAGPVVARLRALGHKNVTEINFGAHSPDRHYAFFRDFMWGQMKDWLLTGAIDKDPGLEADLSGPVLVSDTQQRVKLESKDLMKKRLKKMGKEGDSPDDADALALTFAMPVGSNQQFDEPDSDYDGPTTAWS